MSFSFSPRYVRKVLLRITIMNFGTFPLVGLSPEHIFDYRLKLVYIRFDNFVYSNLVPPIGVFRPMWITLSINYVFLYVFGEIFLIYDRLL